MLQTFKVKLAIISLMLGLCLPVPLLAQRLADLTREERQSINSVCSQAKYLEGAAAYNLCIERQLYSLRGTSMRPNLSSLSREERQSIESVCSKAKYLEGPAAYNRCLYSQLASLRGTSRRPDLSSLLREERQSIESVCSKAKYLEGPAAYNRCLQNQLASLRGTRRRPDLSSLSREERQSIESVCSQAKYLEGPASYNRCLRRKAAELGISSNAQSSAPLPTSPPARPRSSDPKSASPKDVREVQKTLHSLGYDSGPVDGLVGDRTRNAIIAFQTDISAAPTGVVDDILLAQLRLMSKIASANAPKPPTTTTEPVSPRISTDIELAMPLLQFGDKQQRLTAAELFAKRQQSVFVLLAARSATALRDGTDVLQGSAVAISRSLLVTNCHITNQAPYIVIVSGDKVLPARIAAENSQMDLCVLEVERGGLVPVDKIRPYEDLQVGEKVFTIGAPSGLENTLGEGLVSGLREYRSLKLVQTTAPISPGSSGGGLFDAHGNLVGITTFLLKEAQNLNFAIAAEQYWESR